MDANRKFGLSLGGALMALAAYKFLFHHSYLISLTSVGCFLLLGATFCPGVLNPVRKVWEKIGMLLGMVNSYIILTFIFFFIVTPIALFLKLMRKDLLSLKINKNENTYWKMIDDSNDSSLKQQF